MSGLATLAAAGVGAGIARLVRLPGGVLLGALFGAAALHLSVALPPLPEAARVAAQIGIGTVIGARLQPAALRDARRWGPAFGVALVGLAVAAMLGAALLQAMTDTSWWTALLAVIPGGAADATALATAAGDDAPVVAAVHLTRQLLVLVVMGAGLRWWVASGRSEQRPPIGRPRETAGAVVWREQPEVGTQVLLVHRPRYDDWTLPKGGVESGESPREAAERETVEETGWRGTADLDLGTVELRERRGPTEHKRVTFYALEASEPVGFVPSAEVDDVRWVPLGDAAGRCSRPQDREVIGRFIATRDGRSEPHEDPQQS